ncbi:MAG: hypothetical protein RR400_02785 [Clostridia bacterium]
MKKLIKLIDEIKVDECKKIIRLLNLDLNKQFLVGEDMTSIYEYIVKTRMKKEMYLRSHMQIMTSDDISIFKGKIEKLQRLDKFCTMYSMSRMEKAL